MSKDPYVIQYADFRETSLVDLQEKFHKSINIKVAKTMAKDAGLDLVCFNEPSGKNPALCKIINYGKWKYQHDKDLKKNKQHKKETKEIRLSPVIDINDLDHKIDQTKGFIEAGHEVVLSMRFKGIHKRMFREGEALMTEIVKKCGGFAKELHRKRSGNNISVRLAKGVEEK
tara:strand:+ start:9511 stop:10026 length:516 start_codon:yes stop_codon:yes gene_type:complete